MTEQTQTRKLLVLRGPQLESSGILDRLGDHFQIEVVDDLDAALEAMRNGPVAAVLSDTGDFLPLERGVVAQKAAVVLDTIGDGVAVVGSSGHLVWANRRLREAPAELLEPLREVSARAYEQFATEAIGAHAAGRRFSLKPSEEEYYEIICSPVRDRQGLLQQVVAVVVDASRQRRQQQKLNAIDQAGRELVRIDAAALAERKTPERLAVLEDRIIHYSRDVLDYKHFAVLLLNERSNRLEPIVSEGLDEAPEQYDLFASTSDSGICGYVAATGRSYICPDVRRDRRYKPGLRDARSSLTVPLRFGDKVVGVLNVESDRPAAFSEDDRQFAEIFGTYVAMALNILNLLVAERHEAHSQLSGSVCSELAGPLNDLITEANQLVEDYIGHDDLRNRLSELVDLAVAGRQAVQKLSERTAAGVIGKVSQQHDPVLGGLRVLVADDEEMIRQTVRDVLTPCGCAVDVAADGVAAIEKLGANRYDLVISDIKMPGANGYEVFAAAKDADPGTPVMLITGFGYDPGHGIVRARREGLAAVLFKPFKVQQLLQECRKAVGG